MVAGIALLIKYAVDKLNEPPVNKQPTDPRTRRPPPARDTPVAEIEAGDSSSGGGGTPSAGSANGRQEATNAAAQDDANTHTSDTPTDAAATDATAADATAAGTATDAAADAAAAEAAADAAAGDTAADAAAADAAADAAAGDTAAEAAAADAAADAAAGDIAAETPANPPTDNASTTPATAQSPSAQDQTDGPNEVPSDAGNASGNAQQEVVSADPYNFQSIMEEHDFEQPFERARHLACFGCQGSGKTTLVGILRQCANLEAEDLEHLNEDDLIDLIHDAFSEMDRHDSTRPCVEDDEREPTPYRVNDYLFVWDMPGGGTRRMPSAMYAQRLDVSRFAVAVVVVGLTDTEVANNIVDYLHKQSMPVVVVQTHFDTIVEDSIRLEHMARSLRRGEVRRPEPNRVQRLLTERRQTLSELFHLDLDGNGRDRLFCVNLCPLRGDCLLHGPLLQAAHAHFYQLGDAVLHIFEHAIAVHR